MSIASFPITPRRARRNWREASALSLALAALLFSVMPVTELQCDPIETEKKIAYIEDAITNEAHRMHIWSWTWGSIYAAAAITQAAVLPAVDKEALKDLAVGIGAAAFGSLTLFLL